MQAEMSDEAFRKHSGILIRLLIVLFACLIVFMMMAKKRSFVDTDDHTVDSDSISMVEMMAATERKEIQSLDKETPADIHQQMIASKPNEPANVPAKTGSKLNCDNTIHPICKFKTPEDIRTVKLPPFLKDYKNPCWAVDPKMEVLVQPPIRCIPYFFLAGAPKSGTTDLYERIIQHPQVSDKLRKENHWISRFHYIKSQKDPITYPHLPCFRNYTDLFLSAAKDLYSRKNHKGYHDMIFGDGSVGTFWDNTYAIFYSEATGKDTAWNPEAIHHLNPKTKFVSIVRDPVDRVYSDYLYFGEYPNKSKEDFHKRVNSSILNHKTCLSINTLRNCISMDKHHVRIWIGIYHGYYEEFFKFFPREQFYIMTMDEYASDMAGRLTDVFSFLELDPLTPKELSIISDSNKIVNTRPVNTLKIGKMRPETRKMLEEFYEPYNSKLRELLGERFDFNNMNKTAKSGPH